MTDLSHTPVRLGLVGLGLWGNKIAAAAAVAPDVQISHCFARTESTREAFSAQYGCRPVSSYQEMLEDDSIEGVILITPNRVHRDQIMLAAEHGKHVFVDKPITATLEQGVEVIEAMKKAGLVLGVDHECRREVALRKMKQLLEAEALGRLLMVDANISSSTGVRTQADEWRAQPARVSRRPADSDRHPSHRLAAISPWPDRSRVQGWQRRQVLEIPMDDTTVTLLEFENGMLGYLGSGYATAPAAWIHVYGASAIGRVQPHRGTARHGESRCKGHSIDWTAPGASYADPVDMMTEALVDFARCIRTGAKPEVSGMEALTALAVVLAAVKSGATGKAVDIRDELREAGLKART